MRPIDADVAIPLIQEEKIEGKILDIIKALGDGLQAETLNQACDRHIKIISSLPTIDSVKHGKWEPVGSTIMGDSFGELAWGKMYRCSECGFVRHIIKDSEHYKHCPNCGAQMDRSE